MLDPIIGSTLNITSYRLYISGCCLVVFTITIDEAAASTSVVEVLIDNTSILSSCRS